MPRLSDEQLILILQKAARRINRRLCLFGTSNEITLLPNGCITPEDGVLEDLVLLQAECMIAQRDYLDFLNPDSSSAGILVSDGEQSIDNRQAGSSRGAAFNSSINPCAELEKQIAQEKMNRLNNGDGPGKLIW